MKTIILSLLVLAACGPDDFTRAPTEAGADAAASVDSNTDAASDLDGEPPIDAADARADADSPADSPVADANAPCDGGSQLWGQSGCNAIMDAFCTTTYNKCGGMTLQQCRAWWASNFPTDFDCNANKFKAQGCNDYASKCANVEIPSYMCGKLQSSTPSQLGGACASFFAGF
jgi:hypothetical protein